MKSNKTHKCELQPASVTISGPTLFLLGHVLWVAFAVSVVALLLPWGLAAAALHLVHLLRQIARWGHPLRQHLELLARRE